MTKMTKGLLSGLLCLALCLSCLAGCGPQEAPATTAPTLAEERVTHSITVKDSEGAPMVGLGVYVYTDAAMTELVWFAKTDDQGRITFTDVPGDSYVAVLASVPQGYEAEATYALTGTQTEIVLEATLLSADDLEGVSLGLGDVMFDFTVTDTEGVEHSLSQLLQEKEAVVLNFWFRECQPCMAEFPYLQEAYMDYSDRVAVLALNPVNTEEAAVKQVKEEQNLLFPMALVPDTWAEALGITAYPTTVVIDRFGKVTLCHTGSVPSAAGFRAVFETFVGADYEPTVVEDALSLVSVKDTKGSKDDPYEFSGSDSFEVTVAPGETAYVRLYKAFNLYLKIENPNAYVIEDDETHKPEGGKVSFTVNCEDTYTPVELQIGNSGSETQTFQVKLSAKSGTIGNPKRFKLGEFEVKVSAGNEQGVYYQFAAPEDGILTVKCLGGTEGVEYNFALYNLSSYAYRTLEEDGEDSTLSVKVKKGQQIQFIMFTVPDESFKYPKGTFQLLATLGDSEEEEKEDQVETGAYTVTVKDALGNPMADVMMKVEGTDYSAVLTTDSNGTVAQTLPLGDYTVTVTVPADYSAENPVLQLTAAAPSAELVLTKVTATYADYRVTVLAPDGVTPQENVQVILGEHIAATDAAGVAVLPLPVGDYRVYVSNLNPAYSAQQGGYAFAEGSTVLTVVLEDAVPEETEPTEPEQPDTGVAHTVTVTDYAGNPAADVTVALYDSAEQLLQTAQTDAAGQAVLTAVPGSYQVRLLSTDAYYEKSTAVLTPDATEVTVLLAAEPDGEKQTEMWVCDNGSAYDIPAGGTHVKLGSGQFGYSTDKAVTFFTFTPQEAGIYRITTSNSAAVVEYWGSTFFPNRSTPSDYADNAFTVTVQEGNLGGSYALGILGSGECALVITRLGDPGYDPNYVPFEPYTGTIVPEAFTYEDGPLTAVDLSGSPEDYVPVFNPEDGLYHLGAEDGPVLYVNLVSGPKISVYDMVNGQGNIGAQPFRAAFYNEAGRYVKEDYTELMVRYTQCADAATGVYPVNEELMYMLTKGIAFYGWADSSNPNYLFKDEDGNLLEDVNPELAWMFLFAFEVPA